MISYFIFYTVCEIDPTRMNVRAFSLGAFEKKKARTLIQVGEIYRIQSVFQSFF